MLVNPSTPNIDDYSEFQAVDVLDNDIALLPLDGPAEGFKYRKMLILEVPAFLFDGGVSFKDLTWDFAFRVRESAEPESRILFQSETRWTARITVLKDPFGAGLELISWQPLGDAGAGKTTTTIINGEPVDPAVAWKFVDKTRPTENDGQGYTIFSSEGVAAIGTYYFFAAWYSPSWLCDLDEGMVLDANDATSIGSISDEATYEVSTRAGQPLVVARFDQFGGMLHGYSLGQSGGASLGYESFVDLRPRCFLPGKVFSIAEDAWGRVWQLVREASGWFEYVSLDGNRTTRRHSEVPVWPKEVRFARMLIDEQSEVRRHVSVDGFEVTFKEVRPDGEFSVIVGRLPKKQAVTLEERAGKLYIVGEAGVVFVSTNGGRNWQPRGDTPEDVAKENGVLLVSNAR